MLEPLIDLLNTKTPLYPPFGRIVVIVGLFAWPGSSRAPAGGSPCACSTGTTGAIARLTPRRRARWRTSSAGETLVSIIRAGVIYLAFGAAIVLSIAQLTGGVDRLTAIAGASFLIIVASFATEDPGRHPRGPDDVRRALVLGGRHRDRPRGRRLSGRRRGGLAPPDAAALGHGRGHPHPQLADHCGPGATPRCQGELAIEVFVGKREEGERLVADVASILPEGPT